MGFLSSFWVFLLSLIISSGDPRSFNDISRREIVDILQTGRPRNRGEFPNALIEMLLRNNTSPVNDVTLGLFISAVIARNENPRNVRGADLVSDLLQRVNSQYQPNPYLVLVLCNAGAVRHQHLDKIVGYTSRVSNNTLGLQADALVLKALACAASRPNSRSLDGYTDYMIEKAKRIATIANTFYEDTYTTSLVVQALTAYNHVVDAGLEWGEDQALDFLRRESHTGGMTKRYYVTMALHSKRVPFLKELHRQNNGNEIIVKRDILMTLSLRNELLPDEELGLHLKVPQKYTLFEILMKASNISLRFRFSYYLNHGEPLIFEIDNYPNDPEVGLYWYTCSKRDQSIETIARPSLHFPVEGETVVLWYRRQPCPSF